MQVLKQITQTDQLSALFLQIILLILSDHICEFLNFFYRFRLLTMNLKLVSCYTFYKEKNMK